MSDERPHERRADAPATGDDSRPEESEEPNQEATYATIWGSRLSQGPDRRTGDAATAERDRGEGSAVADAGLPAEPISPAEPSRPAVPSRPAEPSGPADPVPPVDDPRPSAEAGPDPLRSALDQLERLQYELPSEASGAADAPGGKLQEIVADLGSSVWAIRGEVEDLPRREDVAALRTAVESVGRTLRQEFAEIEAARDEAGGLLAARVEAALEGVRSDLDAVSAVVRKRLSEADGRRKQDHASLIKVVDDSLRNLSLRVNDLETRWQEFGDEVAARAGEALRGELSRAVVDAMSDVRRELKATMGASPTAELQKELREAIAAVEDEVGGLRKRIEGWGKPRTAPRIAKELQDLKGRVTRTEGDLRGAIMKEIERVLDERLDAFSSAVEARVAALLQPEAGGRRGKRFGRGG